MPSLAWFSYVGKILKDPQFHCSQIVPDFGDIMGNRQVSLPNSSACHFLFVTQWYCSQGWQLSHSSFYLIILNDQQSSQNSGTFSGYFLGKQKYSRFSQLSQTVFVFLKHHGLTDHILTDCLKFSELVKIRLYLSPFPPLPPLTNKTTVYIHFFAAKIFTTNSYKSTGYCSIRR